VATLEGLPGRAGALLASRARSIVDAWLAIAFDSYAASTARVLRDVKDAFRNPVGHTFMETFPVLVDQLLGPMDRTVVTPALDRIVRIRAVQGFTPREALAIFAALRGIIADERRRGPDTATLAIAEARLDDLLLEAFDLYCRCREALWENRAKESRRRIALLERLYARDGEERS
jgi:hypothetical protein